MMRKNAWWLLVVVALIASACSNGESVAGEESVEPRVTTIAEEPSAITTAEAPQPDLVEQPDIGRDSESAVPTEDTRIFGEAEIQAALTNGRDLTVAFGAGQRLGRNFCGGDARVVIQEFPSAVRVQVETVRIILEGAELSLCQSRDMSWALTTTLAEPLGDRRLFDGTTREDIAVDALDSRLLPTQLPVANGPGGAPVELTLHSDDGLFPVRRAEYQYQASTGDPLSVMVVSHTIGAVAEADLTRLTTDWGPISIRSEGDGVVRDQPFRARIIFQEDGWTYRLVASPGIGRSTLTDFARSFERPALADESGLEVQSLQSAIDREIQLGQEEGESGLILGVGDQSAAGN